MKNDVDKQFPLWYYYVLGRGLLFSPEAPGRRWQGEGHMKTCEKCGKSCFIEVDGDEIHCWCCGWVRFVARGPSASRSRGRARRKRIGLRWEGRGHDVSRRGKDY